MIRTLFTLLFCGALATSAAAQSGWDTNSWDAPKKTTKKTTTTKKSGTSTGQSQAAGQQGGATDAAAPTTPGMETPVDAAATTPAAGGFGPVGADNAVRRTEAVYAAPGTPVILQSGSNVGSYDGYATREERNRARTAKINRAAARAQGAQAMPAAAPGITTGAGASMAPDAATPASPAAAGAATGSMGAGGASPAPAATATKTAATPKPAPVKTKVKVKAAPANDGW
jgi:hypothetical protein